MKYNYILMSKEDMYNNEILEEVLRERSSFFISKKKDINFWILNNPSFLNEVELKQNLLNKKYFLDKKDKQIKNGFCCLISTDSNFIGWMKLRLGFFETLKQSDSIRQKIIISNGIFGELENSKLIKSSIF